MLLIIVAFQVSNAAIAQSSKQLDSIVTQTSLLLYSDPKLAISKGKELYIENPNNNKVRISALVIIANSYNALQDIGKSIEYTNRAYGLAQQSKDYINQIRILGFLGSQYLNLEMNKKAWYYLDKADSISKRHPLPDDMRYLQGNIYLLKGLNYKHNLNCDFAINYFNKAIEEFKNNPESNISRANIGQAYSQKGQCYFDLENITAAEPSFDMAIKISEANHTNSLTADALVGKAKISIYRGDEVLALSQLKRALEQIGQGNAISIKTNIYRAFSERYLKLDSLELHRKYYLLFEESNRELVKMNKKSIGQLNTKIRIDEALAFQKEKKNYITILLVLVVILFLSGIWFYFKISKKRYLLRKIKRKLDNQASL